MPSNEPGLSAAPRVETPGPDQTSPEFERADPRVPFLGFPIQIRAGALRCSIRLRDLSCGGASGLCDEALDVGAFVTVCLAKGHEVEAEVRWVRMMNVGLKFTDPLAPGFVRRLHQSNGTFVTTRSGK
ncbi:MAG: PilZ domain-containing protein [Allosphingosinicella sp.]